MPEFVAAVIWGAERAQQYADEEGIDLWRVTKISGMTDEFAGWIEISTDDRA
jgi:hypothetical protein